ncbi:hypothetical protein TSH58p_16415 [Azospirillum sp. TSH58]|uniref:hypothetical protein n=1 Tax=Azospirillum sp. TSH58 TaxID=664962 RepID=UPI000D6004FA|nr:hypothetical protein [Azospirillum sp. TSH58]AWJ84964.1 hypothetical protein TSH58p_16415 [Azospirillum sp. TSH58]PWC71208.1 hypothetical protein TSH58_11345 [Azospirillum sp. TSH58]
MNMDTFALAVLVLCVGALGLSVVYEASRLTASGSRKALVRRKLEAQAADLAALDRRIEDARAESAARQEALDRLTAERGRLTGLIASVKASKIALVHEIGDAQSGAQRYESELRTVPDFARLDPRRMLFARAIWDRRNIARVWADTPDAAAAMLQRAFSARNGVLSSRPETIPLIPAASGANDGARPVSP